MDAAYNVEPAASQIHAQNQTGRTTVIIWTIFDDTSTLNCLPDICQQDTTLIKSSLGMCCQKDLPTAG